ncbi:hypothetical protein SAMN05877809_10727 [Rhodobacter sp. JA431]|uniref:hypothetical protein n=1 Tax=Rhodobacter sp. JA431 TaxID=570013 RepID=UPI000BCE3EF2|nr:hypothetical protein [Rhodobacter sp. JA431]SOC13860.1 hypothetical protein SAMN05877809_10727 [Rhodobacter sp. JA431]
MRRDAPRFLHLRDGLTAPHQRPLSVPAFIALTIVTLVLANAALRTALELRTMLDPKFCAPANAAAPLFPECH